MAGSASHNGGPSTNEQHIKAFEKVIADTQLNAIRLLHTQFGALYSDWEMVVFSSGAFSNPPSGKRNHNISFNVKKLIDSVPVQVEASKRAVTIEIMSKAVEHLYLDNQDLAEISSKDIPSGFMQQFQALNKFKALEWKLYELPVVEAKNKIRRYQEESGRLGSKQPGIKTMGEMLKEDGQEREKIVVQMMEIEKEQGKVMGGGGRSGGRKNMEARLNGAEPWKETRAQNDNIVGSFLEWERVNGFYGRPGALEEFWKIQAASGAH